MKKKQVMVDFPSTWFISGMDMYLDDFGCFINQYLGLDIHTSCCNFPMVEQRVSQSPLRLWDIYTQCL